MEQKVIAGLRLFFNRDERDAAALITTACERSVPMLYQHWGLAAPEDCRVYVMTSWLQFLLQAAPWPWKIYLVLTLPLVAGRAMAIWPYSGGWALSFGRRRVVGVKPPRLIGTGDRSLGEQFFTRDRDLSETVQTVTCHELVHAFTNHLRLPTWLHEGLATLAMEYYLERSIVRKQTLESLDRLPAKNHGRGVEKLRVDEQEAFLCEYARGYWLARYIDETRPGLMKNLLSERRSQDAIEATMASAYGKDRDRFWMEINGEMISHFNARENAGSSL